MVLTKIPEFSEKNKNNNENNFFSHRIEKQCEVEINK